MARVYVAMLRGINVGGHNKVPMKDLAVMFHDAGCAKVQTYIQSGNVIFEASPRELAKIPSAVGAFIQHRLNLQIPIIVRSAEQMAEVAAGNPFLLAGVPEEDLHVSFLAGAPAKERVALLDPQRSPPDEFHVLGQEIYFRFPKGGGTTRLTSAYLDSKLGFIGTTRNWRTVTKLLALMQAAD